MLCVYVLRLLPDELAAGRVVGEIEHVASKCTAVIRNVDELVGFLAEGHDGEAGRR